MRHAVAIDPNAHAGKYPPGLAAGLRRDDEKCVLDLGARWFGARDLELRLEGATVVQLHVDRVIRRAELPVWRGDRGQMQRLPLVRKAPPDFPLAGSRPRHRERLDPEARRHLEDRRAEGLLELAKRVSVRLEIERRDAIAHDLHGVPEVARV